MISSIIGVLCSFCVSSSFHILISSLLRKLISSSCQSNSHIQGQKIREVYLPIPAENPTLGISLQWTPLSVTEDVWHILDVIPNSPADNAGLLPYGDYVIGSPEGLVRGDSGLGELVEDVSSHVPPMSIELAKLNDAAAPQQAAPALCLQP
jgi:S1-C subfamily serine protease